MSDDAHPLPDYVAGDDCPGPDYLHRMGCENALRWKKESRDLPGRRTATSWLFPLTVTTQMRVEVELDPAGIIRDHLDDYLGYQLQRGFEPWERPLNFLVGLIIEDNGGADFAPAGWDLAHDSSRFDDDARTRLNHWLYPTGQKWGPEHTDALHAELGITVDDDGNLVAPPTPAQVAADVESQLPIEVPQNTPFAQLVADLRDVDDATINAAVSEALHQAAERRVAKLATADRGDRLTYLSSFLGNVDAVRARLLP